MLLSRVLTIFFLLIIPESYADTIDANLSNSAAQFELGFPSSAGGVIRSSLFYDNQGNALIDGGLLAKGGEGDKDASSGVNGGGGVKLVAGRMKQNGSINMVTCVALGGQLSLTPAAAPSIAFVGEVFDSLQVTTFGSADHFSEFTLRLEMGPPQAKFYVGYREISLDMIGSGNYKLNSGSYIGVLFTF